MKKNYYLLIFSLWISFFLINCASTGALFQDTKNIVEQMISVGGDYEIAYKYRTNKPDELIRQLPQSIEAYRKKNPYEFIRQLADYIDKNSTNDFDRVKKAHDWIALNIQYDINTANSNYDSQSPGIVVSRGSAVCAGYARLFKALCDAMSINCVYIRGYAYGPYDDKHAWNKVQINGDWYLIDVTWDNDVTRQGYGKRRNDEVDQYDTNYLFMKPEHFIFSHLPDNPQDQLLKNPVSFSQYIILKDFFSPNFFDTVDNINPDYKTKFQTNGVLELSFLLKDDSEIGFNVYDGKGKIISDVASAQKVGQKEYKTTFNFPKKGNYVVRIFSRQKSGGSAYCGRFNVRVTESILNSQSNPVPTNPMPMLNENWERIIIENVGSFEIPPTMELQDGPYKLSKNLLINTLSMNQMISQIIVQQKGLNNSSNDGFSRYARVIFKTETGSRDKGLFLNMDILQFSKDNILTLNDFYKDATQSEFSSTGMKLLEWYPLKVEKINEMSCIHISYKRQMGNNQPVIEHTYHFFNYDYDHLFIMSYRENEKDYWENDFKIILNSLRIKKRR
jgi:hypothetical protein